MSVENIIKEYNLAPHPEGGYFKEIYRSANSVNSSIAGEQRNALTHVYFLLGEGQISRFHRVLHDEIWNFYEGAPIQIIQFNAQGLTEKNLGPGCNGYVDIVPGSTWQAATTTGTYSLVGCSVAPGFDFKDFSFLKDTPDELKRFQAEQSGYMHFL